ncbi:MAG: hypothetical protein J6Y60_05375 [Treponema sp.]|nr:hypothetical protein [Treponema sp.]
MQMRLHKSGRIGEYESFPIYEIKYDRIEALGIVTEESSDAVGDKANKYRQWRVINNDLEYAIANNAPRREDQAGNIIPFWHRFNNQIGGEYNLDADVLSSFSAIEQAVMPEDWGANPNYVYFDTNVVDGHTLRMPLCVRLTDTFEPSRSYYEDTKRTQLRMFYTDSGYSFSVAKASYLTNETGHTRNREYCIADFPEQFSTSRPHYSYTNSANTVYDSDYSIAFAYSITNSGSDSSYQDASLGFNCPMFFVHYNDGETDYYGIAVVQMTDFTEQSTRMAIKVSAFDAKWWGSSVVSGGEGSGFWGDPNTVSGGQGSFSYTSDSRGDRGGTYIIERVSQIITSISPFFSGEHGYKIHQLLPADMSGIFGCLYSSDYMDRFTQSFYNPLSAAISLHMIPSVFVNPRNISSPIVMSDYPIRPKDTSPQNAPVYPELNPIGYFGEHNNDPNRGEILSFDFEHFFDAFPDFAPYTQIKLHLPYIGVVDIDTNAVMYGVMHIMYVCDVMSGNVVASVWCSDKDGNNHPLYSLSGNCAYTFPLFALNQDGSSIGKVFSGAFSALTGIALRRPDTAIGGVTDIISGAIGAGFAPQSTSIVGSFGGNIGLISDTDVFLEITRPVWVEPDNFQKLKGIPSMLSGTLADCGNGSPYSGYCQVDEIELDGISATESEQQELISILKQGVFIRGDEL